MRSNFCLSSATRIFRSTPSSTLNSIKIDVLTHPQLFFNQSNSWKIHLHAGTNIVRDGVASFRIDEFITLPFDSPQPPSPEAAPADPTDHHHLMPDELITFSFFSGVIIWLDAISCITSGQCPDVLCIYPAALSPKSNIHLEDIMGCKVWAMILIGRVAELQAYKSKVRERGEMDEIELAGKADRIRQDINESIAANSLSCLNLSNQVGELSYCSPRSSPLLITQIFALAAGIYLHLVIFGFQEGTECLRSKLSEAMDILHTETPRDILPSLVCPLYIIGCVARPEDQPFFRDVFLSAPLLDPSLKHRARILPVLEAIWNARNYRSTTMGWDDVLQMTDANILLF
jgi:hypothetical protein